MADLLTHRANLRFPVWTPTGKSDDEHRLCLKAAMEPGYLCLDQSLSGRRCTPGWTVNLIVPNDELIHVKWSTHPPRPATCTPEPWGPRLPFTMRPRQGAA